MVVDTGSLEALVVEVAAEEYYALRHRVPHRADLRPRSGADSDRLEGQGGARRPARRGPRPPGGRVRWHPASRWRTPRPRTSTCFMAACGTVPATVFDTQIVAGFLGMSTPSLSRLVERMLGISLPKADRLSDWLERPISARPDHLCRQRRRPPPGTPARSSPSVYAPSTASSGRSANATRCWATAPRPASPRRRGGGWGTSGACLAAPAASHRRSRRGGSARPPRPTGRGAWCSRTSGLLAISQRPPRNAEELRRARGVDGRHLAQGRAAEILRAVQRGIDLPPEQIRMPSEGRDAPRRRRPSPSAPVWCARSPTTSTSIRVCWPPGPTSRSCSAASRAGSIPAGGATSWETPCGASSPGTLPLRSTGAAPRARGAVRAARRTPGAPGTAGAS